MSRLVRTMLLGIAFSVAVLTVGVGLILVNIMGGFDDLLKGERPEETDPEVVAAREHASADLARSGDSLAGAAVPATGGARLAGGEIGPRCAVGQHNWKIDDPYDLSCDLVHLEVVASPSVAAFREQMVALDTALRADGWLPSTSFGLRGVLTGYWDRRDEFFRGYDVDNLPNASYSRGTGDARRTLAVQWARSDSTTDAITFASEDLTLGGGATSLAEVLAGIPTEGYAVVLTESVTYFEE